MAKAPQLTSLARQTGRARKLVGVLQVPEYRRALRHGVAASVEHEAIPLRVDFATVIDVGANRGQFAVFAARRFPKAQLICFEPLSGPREQLTRAVGSNPRLRVLDCAVGSEDGAAEFHVSASDDSSSLLPIGQRQRDAFPGTEESALMPVQVKRLDSALHEADLGRPTLLKIDVQGGELEVIQGAGRLLLSIDAVLVEVSFVELYAGQALVDAVWAHLRESAFSCRGIWSLTYGPRRECLQGDLLFAREGFEPLQV
jgi:FkbM family methyltransferase